jgi:hypothetical protein
MYFRGRKTNYSGSQDTSLRLASVGRCKEIAPACIGNFLFPATGLQEEQIAHSLLRITGREKFFKLIFGVPVYRGIGVVRNVAAAFLLGEFEIHVVLHVVQESPQALRPVEHGAWCGVLGLGTMPERPSRLTCLVCCPIRANIPQCLFAISVSIYILRRKMENGYSGEKLICGY